MGLLAWFKKLVCNKRKKENKPKNVEAELRTRRLYMVTESRIKQKKLQNQSKFDSKLNELEVEWCTGPGSLDEIVSKIQQRGEATNKHERAMAYAFSHQWKVSSNRCFGQTYYDVSKESCGWCWMERWITVCPWEVRVVARPIVLTLAARAVQTNKQDKKIKHVKTKMLVTVKPQKGTKKGPNKASNGTS